MKSPPVPPVSCNIAVLCPTFADEITNELVTSLCHEAGKHTAQSGQIVQLHLIDGDNLGFLNATRRAANDIYRVIRPEHYAGMICFGGVLAAGSNLAGLAAFYRDFAPLPLVEISTDIPGVASVCLDNEGGSHALTQHFIQVHGYRELGYLSGPAIHPEAIARLTGYRRALAEAGLAVQEDWIWYGNFMPNSGWEAAQEIQRRRSAGLPIPRAILCANDEMARSLQELLQGFGFAIPGDIAIGGFDDRGFGAAMEPALSSVNQPIGKMAAAAFGVLMEGINRPPQSPAKVPKIQIPAPLSIRTSCGCTESEAPSWAATIKTTRQYLSIRDSRYNITFVEQELSHCHDTKGIQEILDSHRQKFGIHAWAIFLAEAVAAGDYQPLASSSPAIRWPEIWQAGPTTRENPGGNQLRLLLPLIWNESYHGLIAYDCHPDMVLSSRDLTLTINRHLHNREIQTALESRNLELAANLKLLTETQRDLVDSRKVAALGNLLAGFAHEINTPLGVSITIVSYIENQLKNLQLGPDDTPPSADAINKHLASCQESSALIHSSLNRIRDLIRQLQQLAPEKEDSTLATVPLKESLEAAIMIKKVQLQQAGIKASVSGDSKLCLVTMRNRLMTIFNQLIDNALLHAWPDGSAGQFSLDFTAGSRDVTIHYRDNGVGLAPIVQAQLFEPFVTTARLQRRIGLGLHMVYLIVTQMLGGSIEHDNTAPQGLHLIIRLPVKLEIPGQSSD